MKKKLLLASALCLPMISMADNFNYPSPAACQQAVGGQQGSSYMNQAMTLAFEQKPYSEEWSHFMNEAQFFNQFTLSSTATAPACSGDTCTVTASVGCNWAFHTDQAPWTTVIAPFLEKQVELLKQGKYDPSLSTTPTYNITCTYPSGSENKYQNCQIKAA